MPAAISSGYTERDDYFRPASERKQPSSSSSDTARRDYHDTLAKMLLGKSRKELSKDEANQISNFAAYLTGEEEYVDTW